jgi:hypothetical protein
MRPDKTKVMFSATKNPHVIQAIVHKQYPMAWKEGKVAAFIETLRKAVHVVVIYGDQRTFLGGDAPMPPELIALLIETGVKV